MDYVNYRIWYVNIVRWWTLQHLLLS